MSLAKPLSDVSKCSPTPSPARSKTRVGAWAAFNDDSTVVHLPNQDQLPSCDGEPLETERHRLAMQLLIASLQPWLWRRCQATGEGGYVGGNMFLYFSPEQLKNRHFRGPDVMVALGVKPGERKSWVAWHEGKGPGVVIELLSDTTRKTDKKVKPRVYRDEVGVLEYFWFDPFNHEDFAGFAFSDGDPGQDDPTQLQPNLEPNDNGRITCETLGLQLGPWRGRYTGVDAIWLRWYTPEGELLLTEDAERANEEAKRADEANRRADEANRRADRLGDKLRELGLDPEQVL